MGIIGLLIYGLVASACASIGTLIVSSEVPGGITTSLLVGILGAWLGVVLIGYTGPVLGGVAVLPAILGSMVLIVAMNMIAGMSRVLTQS